MHIQQKVGEALSSLDHITPASAGPFFYTRVHARLTRSEKNIWEKLSLLVSRPSVAIIGICLVIFVNTLTVLDFKETAPSIAEQTEPVYDEEYSLAVTSIYDIENSEP